MLGRTSFECPGCGVAVDRDASNCGECGASMDEDATYDIVIGETTTRVKGGKNLQALMATLEAIEDGSGTWEQALGVAEPLRHRYRDWVAEMRATPAERLAADDVMEEMHGHYIPLATEIEQILGSYAARLRSQDLNGAKQQMIDLANAMLALRDLYEQYAALGY